MLGAAPRLCCGRGLILVRVRGCRNEVLGPTGRGLWQLVPKSSFPTCIRSAPRASVGTGQKRGKLFVADGIRYKSSPKETALQSKVD